MEYNPSYVAYLPKETWQAIFLKLELTDIKNVEKVNKVFKSITESNFFWIQLAPKYCVALKPSCERQKKAFIKQLMINSVFFISIATSKEELGKEIKITPNLFQSMDIHGNTLTHIFARTCQIDEIRDINSIFALANVEELIQIYKKNLHDLSIKNFQGNTPFHLACQNHNNKKICEVTFGKLLDWALETNFNFLEQNNLGQTIIHLLCKKIKDPFFNETTNEIELLYKKLGSKSFSFQLLEEDIFGLTPLHYAILHNNIKTATFLIKRGAFLQNSYLKIDKYIHNNLKKKQHKCLLNKKLNPALLDSINNDFSSKKGLLEVLDTLYTFIITFKEDCIQLKKALHKIILSTPTELINTQNKRGFSLAHFAAIINHAKSIASLAKKKADLMLLQDGYTPLHLAIIYGNAEAFFALKLCKAKFSNSKEISLALMIADCPSYKIIYFCLNHCQFTFYEEEVEDIINKIEQSHINIRDTSTLDFMLFHAIRTKNIVAQLALLQKGANFNYLLLIKNRHNYNI